MSLRRQASALAACASLCVPQARAHEPAEPVLDAIIVEGQRHNGVGNSDAASEGTATRQMIEERPALRPGEVLEFVPGVIVSQHSGDGKASQYYLRGFNLDHGTDFATFVDGMPVNARSHAHGQGYTDINFVIPELVESIEYRKGTYYADTGNFSAAGAVNMHYRTSLDAPFVALESGDHDYMRGLFAASPEIDVCDVSLKPSVGNGSRSDSSPLAKSHAGKLLATPPSMCSAPSSTTGTK